MRLKSAAVVFGAMLGLSPALGQAQDNAACSAMVGTWLTTIETGAGDYASRSLMTVQADGTLSAVDSAQDQGLQGSSFSSQQGAWRCTSAGKASARTLNFGFPSRESIARTDWTLALDGMTLIGTAALHIFPGVKGIDPFRADSKPLETFRFKAQRVSAP
ncbi:MAG: hypothetical protein AB7R90_17710 [Reyranellaceae bacterium]